MATKSSSRGSGDSSSAGWPLVSRCEQEGSSQTPAIDVDAVHRRDRRIVLAGLAGIIALSWAYLVHLSLRMAAMPQEPMQMPGMHMPQWQPWGTIDFALMLLMWVVMMAGMMVPSASPMILMFTRVNRDRLAKGGTVVPTAVFLAGYAIVWSAFSLAATLAQWGLHLAALLSPTMVSTSPILGGLLLITAGAFQWSALKHACLSKCRTPLSFLLTEWRDGHAGALVMGLRHGIFCAGCCWALMALLFVGGVMNLLWVSAIAAFVLVEKIAPRGLRIERGAGLGLMAWGTWMLFDAIH
jgi:predicted metal-binding membrane protein